MRACCSGCDELRAAVVQLAKIVRDLDLPDCDVEVELDQLIERVEPPS